MRAICRGESVDPGTAAQFRLLWRSEAEKTHPPSSAASFVRPLILRTHLDAGDALVLTAAIYSLHRAHPGRYLTAVDTPHAAVFENNPDIISLDQARRLNAEEVETHYPAINNANEHGIHFMEGYCQHLSAALGVEIPLVTNRPKIYLTHLEKVHPYASPFVQRPYWLINSGTRDEFTLKGWGHERYQAVVDALPQIHFVQVGAEKDNHRPLKNVVNLVGKTSLRDLIRLAFHAQGVLCGITLLQHLAAALQKPSVIIMGGREPVQWNQYPMQQSMHTIGALSCCKTGGCWRSRVEDCVKPAGEVGECMTLITVEDVVKKIVNYIPDSSDSPKSSASA